MTANLNAVVNNRRTKEIKAGTVFINKWMNNIVLFNI